jgi:3-methyladenine DNA glycosylase/8-oxoguanine DNA glycosylase
MSDPVPLTLQHSIELLPVAPFHFDATVHKPDHFPSADNDWQPGVRWQTMWWQGVSLGLKLEDRGTVEQPRVGLSVWSAQALDPPFLEALAAEVTYRLNLHLDLTDFYHRFQAHRQLGPVLARWRGMRPAHFGSLYEYLIIAIVLQNATVRRSVNMLQALLERCGTLLSYDGKHLFGFWPPQAMHAVSEEELRQLKVGYRARSIQRVTAAFVEGPIDEFDLRRRPFAEQRQALLNLYGIGPASVEYILFDVFHHWDALEHISPWEQKIYSKLFFDRDPDDPAPVEALQAYFEQHFAGYRALAVHYLWENLFWRQKHGGAAWLEKLIRL